MEAKRALATTEMAIAIGITVAVVIVAISLFGDNLKNLAINTGMKNVLTKTSVKTRYTAQNRDYTRSQIDVQITGAQGLEMLRKKANNKALEVIKANFSSTNPDGVSIAYLAKAVEILSGEPHFCGYMISNSDKHCGEIANNNYSYIIQNSSAPIGLTRKTDDAHITLNYNSSFAGSLNSFKIPLNKNNYPTLSTEEKYKALVDITEAAAKNNVRKDCLLFSINDYSQPSDKDAVKALSNDFAVVFEAVLDRLKFVKDKTFNASSKAGKAENKSDAFGYITGDGQMITDDDIETFKAWANKTIKDLNEVTTAKEAVEVFNKAINNDDIVEILSSDVIDYKNAFKAVDVLKYGIEHIQDKYNSSGNGLNNGTNSTSLSNAASQIVLPEELVSKELSAYHEYLNRDGSEASRDLYAAMNELEQQFPFLDNAREVGLPILETYAKIAEKVEEIPIIGDVFKAAEYGAVKVTTAVVKACTTVVKWFKSWW